MPRDTYTILILPRKRNRFRKLHLSVGFIASVAVLAGVVVLAALLAPHLAFRLESKGAEFEKLSQDYALLGDENRRFEAELDRVEGQLSRFEAQTGRLASELGVDDLLEPAAGGSGPAGAGGSGLDAALGALKSRAESLDESLAQLDELFTRRMRLLASTPKRMPVEGWFSHGFGWRKDPWNGERRFHRGIDIVADSGTPVVAPADGVVSRTARQPDYGKMLDLSHGYGYVTRYGHLSEILVKPGQRVRRGEVVGRVGSTGRSTGPHLHYEVFRDGRRVNPWKYLGQKGR